MTALKILYVALKILYVAVKEGAEYPQSIHHQCLGVCLTELRRLPLSQHGICEVSRKAGADLAVITVHSQHGYQAHKRLAIWLYPPHN